MFDSFAAPLMDALETLLTGILERWDISPAGVIGHSDMAPDRKRDPGPRFDWRRLARGALSVWPEEVPGTPFDPQRFRRHLMAFGYPDLDDDLLLQAFRLRFHPGGRGSLSARDCAIAAGLPRD